MQDIVNEINELNNIHITWRDYTLMMLNSTADPLRTIWREKLVSSIISTEFKKSSTCEGNLVGLKILSLLPSEFTQSIVNDSFEEGEIKLLGRLSGSKRMGLIIGHYPQESPAEETRLCLHYIIDNWDEYGHFINEIPTLRKIWDISQISHGKCLYPDEILTYTLERYIDEENDGWIDVVYDIFLNGIDDKKFKKYYFNDKLVGFPLTPPRNLEEQQENFINFIDIFLKEDITSIASWKRIAICILKNDVSFSYAGFGKTFKEKQAREEAIAAFSLKEEEKKKAKEEILKLTNKIINNEVQL